MWHFEYDYIIKNNNNNCKINHFCTILCNKKSIEMVTHPLTQTGLEQLLKVTNMEMPIKHCYYTIPKKYF